MKLSVISLFLFFSISASAQLSSVGASIVDTAQSQLGKNVGNKMCYAFVEEVLKRSGTMLDTSCMVDTAQPGDVFVTYGFYRVKTKPSKYIVLDGIGSHIAIVKKNLGNDCYLILEQNADGKGSVVQMNIINLKMYGKVHSLGYTFIRPKPGAFTELTGRLVRGLDPFPITNYQYLPDTYASYGL